MSTEIAERLAEFITKTKLEDVPKEAVEFTKCLALKTVAGILAGSAVPSGKKMAEFVRKRKHVPEVGVMGHAFKTSLWDAVLANAVFAHASELEDDRFNGGVSWDITVFPVTLALAERNNLSGKQLLEASVVGLEVHCRTCRFPTEHLGLVVTPGAIGPAAAAAKAMGLSAAQTFCALGIAMSAAPVSLLNFGTDAHFFESAIQSVHGLMAGELAGAGMSGNPEIGRYLSILLGKERVRREAIIENLGTKWLLRDIWVKKYPCCFGTHRQIDALLELMKEYDLSYEQIEETEVHVCRPDRILDRPAPKTLGDLQFSFQHVLAAAMIDRDVNLGHFIPEMISDKNLQEARAKVKIIFHDDWSSAMLAAPIMIVLKLKDGRQLSRERKVPIGSPGEPLTVEQIKDLYRKFTRGILSQEQIESTADSILNLEKLSDVKALMGAFAL